MISNRDSLKPLGTIAPRPGQEWSPAGIDRSSPLPMGLRERIAAYLEPCPVFLAWMGYTRDEIAGRFEVPGGAAIASDGTYYWRLDGVEYLKEYGVPVPADAVRHFEERGWVPPAIAHEEYLRIYRELGDLLGGGEVVG